MTGADLLPASVLNRKAVVYVRQSSPVQVLNNLEGKRRQYDLVDLARSHGFRDVAVIDDDLGRSADGMVERPGFERLVAWLCAGGIAPCCASTPPAWPATAVTGTTCSNSAAWSGQG
jgi:hypothetical protein